MKLRNLLYVRAATADTRHSQSHSEQSKDLYYTYDYTYENYTYEKTAAMLIRRIKDLL